MFENARNRYEAELLCNITPFWESHSLDAEYGGFFSCLDREGKVYDTLKQMWMQWREVYMFASLYNSAFRTDPWYDYRQGRWLEIAENGAEWLMKHGRIGPGKYAYMLNRRGEVTELTPSASADFTACFAAMACAELFRATKKSAYREEALAALAVYNASAAAAERGNPQLPAKVVYRQLAHPMFRLNVMIVLERCGIGDYGCEMDAAVDGRQFHSYKGSRFKTFFHLPRHLLNCIEIMERIG